MGSRRINLADISRAESEINKLQKDLLLNDTKLPKIITFDGTDSTTKYLTSADNNSMVILRGATATTLVLPDIEFGLHYEVYVGTAQVHAVQARTNVINGNYRHNSASTTTTRVAVSNKGKLTFHATNVSIGDRLYFWCDGTYWWVDGMVYNALTLATI